MNDKHPVTCDFVLSLSLSMYIIQMLGVRTIVCLFFLYNNKYVLTAAATVMCVWRLHIIQRPEVGIILLISSHSFIQLTRFSLPQVCRADARTWWCTINVYASCIYTDRIFYFSYFHHFYSFLCYSPFVNKQPHHPDFNFGILLHWNKIWITCEASSS